MELNVHSQIDAITNSSTETYSMNNEAAVDFTYELLSNVAKVLGIKDDIKTLFKVEYQVVTDLYITDITEYLECEDEDKYDELIAEFEKFKENNKDLKLPKRIWDLKEVEDNKVFNSLLEKVGTSRKEIEKAKADFFLEEGRGWPPETKIVVTPLNDKAKVIDLDFTRIVSSGEVWYD